MFSEFAGRKPVKEVSPDDPDTYMGSGDVKYHLGTSYDRPTISGELFCSFGLRAGCQEKYHLGTSYGRPPSAVRACLSSAVKGMHIVLMWWFVIGSGDVKCEVPHWAPATTAPPSAVCAVVFLF